MTCKQREKMELWQRAHASCPSWHDRSTPACCHQHLPQPQHRHRFEANSNNNKNTKATRNLITVPCHSTWCMNFLEDHSRQQPRPRQSVTEQKKTGQTRQADSVRCGTYTPSLNLGFMVLCLNLHFAPRASCTSSGKHTCRQLNPDPSVHTSNSCFKLQGSRIMRLETSRSAVVQQNLGILKNLEGLGLEVQGSWSSA